MCIKTSIPQKLINSKLTGAEKLVVFSLHSTIINLFLKINLFNIIIMDLFYLLFLQLLSNGSLKAEKYRYSNRQSSTKRMHYSIKKVTTRIGKRKVIVK